MPLEWAMILIDLHGDRFRKTACAILNALNGVPGSKKLHLDHPIDRIYSQTNSQTHLRLGSVTNNIRDRLNQLYRETGHSNIHTDRHLKL
ncbi:MAG: hypothetical protein HC770_11895 [Pseudanabaena sp. CRU_2_10]|nr:hypothetical protein [Pseudanabaena sp. CRU_2_10]